MPAFRIFIISTLIFGTVLCRSVFVFGQNDTANIVHNDGQEIDTTDYIPSFYETALNYNLIIAVSKGYTSEIDRLISKGADVNTETIDHATPLIFAVTNNDSEAVKTILKYNPLLDQITLSSETPLIIAVKKDNPDICEKLIRAGADVDLTDKNGATPLHIASLNGFLEIADLLLYYNASIDQKSDEGLTPLLAAIMAGYIDVADLLIQNGANMEARDNKGFTPFLMAALNGDTLTMDLLSKHKVDIYTTSYAKYNALDLAILANQPEAVRYLLRIGDKWGDSKDETVNPYVVASKYRRKDIISILSENNVKGQVKYGIDQVMITLSTRFVLKDIYTGMSFSFKEPYLNGGLITGMDMKLWHTRVLIKDSENTYYQYFDKGYLAYAGVFKDFMLLENPFKSSLTLSGSLLAGYSFGHMLKGTMNAPENAFLLIPDITLRWGGKNLSGFMGLEYIKSQFYKIGPVWIRAGFSHTLFFDKVRTQVKPIKWY
jgi:ankyrin repeat protein